MDGVTTQFGALVVRVAKHLHLVVINICMTTHDYSTLAYGKVNLEFDHEVFINEYDKHILPASIPISNS